MNSLLERQLRKHLPAEFIEDPRLQNFLKAIDGSYQNFEDQFKMSQRAMRISSDELFEANEQLREEAKRQEKIISSLNYVVKILNLKSSENNEDLSKAADLANFIEEQSKQMLIVNHQREELLKDLEQKNQELNDYAHIVSHDLKSPLRSINSLVSWILEDHRDEMSSDCKSNLDLVLKNVEKMDDMIQGILNYSSIDRADLDAYDINTHRMVENFLETLHKPDHVKIEIDNVLPTVRADKFRLMQLFQNLIQNAINSIEHDHGEIHIGTVKERNKWVFYIKDNGKGIPERYFKKIFEIFQSIDEDKSATGIGLSIVKKIVDYYGGRIWLESTPGKGTVFYFTLQN